MISLERAISNLELNIRLICCNPAHQFPGCGNVEMAMRDAVELLKERHRPLIYGHWVNDEQCSECDCDAPSFLSGSSWVMHKTRYCPNCGASMDNANMELYDE